jgi:hypothetical protein
MIKRILILVLSTLLSGAGSYIFRGCENDKEVAVLKKTITLMSDTLTKQKDSTGMLKHEVVKLKQADSSNRFFIAGKEKVLIEQRNILRNQDKELVYLRRWKADAEADGIITPDTVQVKKRFLRKGYKVVK